MYFNHICLFAKYNHHRSKVTSRMLLFRWLNITKLTRTLCILYCIVVKNRLMLCASFFTQTVPNAYNVFKAWQFVTLMYMILQLKVYSNTLKVHCFTNEGHDKAQHLRHLRCSRCMRLSMTGMYRIFIFF